MTRDEIRTRLQGVGGTFLIGELRVVPVEHALNVFEEILREEEQKNFAKGVESITGPNDFWDNQ